jgi:hypothetical protein
MTSGRSAARPPRTPAGRLAGGGGLRPARLTIPRWPGQRACEEPGRRARPPAGRAAARGEAEADELFAAFCRLVDRFSPAAPTEPAAPAEPADPADRAPSA